jgi:fatty-acyl-CoA synthase
MTIGEWAGRVRRLATVLDTLGVSADGRVGTFCWNTGRHLELYLAAPCTGRVLHTLNIRLFPEQLVYIVDHAEDEVVFVDRSLIPVIAPLADKMGTVRHVRRHRRRRRRPRSPTTRASGSTRSSSPRPSRSPARFVVEDENTAAAMCYTSGTTGNPKGVVYSAPLGAAALARSTLFGRRRSRCRERDVVLPVVPMFHANAWGLPYGCLLAGTDLVCPGPDMTPDAIVDAAPATTGSPSPRASRRSGWAMLPLARRPRPVVAAHDLLCGGSAVPKSLSEVLPHVPAIGLPLTAGIWGMTETSPIATMGVLALPPRRACPTTSKATVRALQGHPRCRSSTCGIADPETGAEAALGRHHQR